MSGRTKAQQAMFGAGCFWGVEARFREIPGVLDVTAGYSGGTKANPSYEDVCSHETGHAEVVRLEFDPTRVSYEQLVKAFFELHDPTTLNRHGLDVGTQYRSVIFNHSPEQKSIAEKIKNELGRSGRFKKPIVTRIEPAAAFWRAEEDHQQYLKKHGISCSSR